MLPFEPEIPLFNDPDLERLLVKLSSDMELISVPIQIDSEAQILDCFNIIAKKIKNDGGKMICGWAIWKLPKVNIMESEHHAIWESNDGELYDLTPKESSSITKILFLEDDKMNYTGKTLDRVRINLSDNIVVEHFIKSHEIKYALMHKGKLAFLFDEEWRNTISDRAYREIESLEFGVIAKLFNLLIGQFQHTDDCFCKSNKTYLKCHGKGFVSRIVDKKRRKQLIEQWSQ